MKSKRIILTIVAAVVLAVICVTGILSHPWHYRDALLMDDAAFGMTRGEIETVFGKPILVENSKADGGAKTFCRHELMVCGYLSDVTFTYVSSGFLDRLCTVYISVPTTSDEESRQVFSNLTSRLRAVQGSIIAQSNSFFSFEINDGATGVVYDIRIKAGEVTAQCYASF